MSFLFAKEPGVAIPEVAISAITSEDSFSEMGLCYSWDGRVIRQVGFHSLADLLAHTPLDSSALIYLDNPKDEYGENEFSPLLVGKDMAFAFCGEMLALDKRHTGKSNNSVFNNMVMKKSYATNPSIINSTSFHWMIVKIARSFIGGAILKGDGSFHFFNKHLFKNSDGFSYMDSEQAETDCFHKNWSKPELAGVL